MNPMIELPIKIVREEITALIHFAKAGLFTYLCEFFSVTELGQHLYGVTGH